MSSEYAICTAHVGLKCLSRTPGSHSVHIEDCGDIEDCGGWWLSGCHSSVEQL